MYILGVRRKLGMKKNLLMFEMFSYCSIVRGRTSVIDEPRPGAPKTATTGDNVKKIHDLVWQTAD